MSKLVTGRGSRCWEGAREWGGSANRWLDEGAGGGIEMSEATRDRGGEGGGGEHRWGTGGGGRGGYSATGK